MVLMFVVVLAVGAALLGSLAVNNNRLQKNRVRTPNRGLRTAALAIAFGALAVVAVPPARALAAGVAAQVQPVRKAGTDVATSTEGASTQAREYAAREASAKNLEQFQGGATTVVIGG
ncbi:MAG: hypothetical protein H7X95_11675, partial [Deltaproteobacteria bacterium]|nr:hypothetical protein [Deltaproteobacteria bacterium]